ncbi:MAG: NAD(+) diphosphatase [Spirochaetaceae bacterium]|nr:NAD(+) diphosphatase [Spirochaetaceae bacterium]
MVDIAQCFLFVGQDILLPREEPAASGSGGSGGGSDGATRPGPGHEIASCAALLEWPADHRRRDFRLEDRAYAAFSLDEAEAAARAGKVERMPLRQAMGLYDPAAMKGAIKASALLNWIGGARRCGACGEPLADAPRDGDDEGGRVCPSCGRAHFPRISPAVIVLVRKEGKVLLARNARFPAGRFGLIAGFVEIGETLEEAAVREAREEAGIEIGNLRYRKSQSWPFPDSLMLAFTADWLSGEARPDGREIVELRWCGPDDLSGIPPLGSVARWLIDSFGDGLF